MWSMWKALNPVVKGLETKEAPETSGLEYVFSGGPHLSAWKPPVPTLAQAELALERRLAEVQAALSAMKAATPEDKAGRARDVAKAYERLDGAHAQLVEVVASLSQ